MGVLGCGRQGCENVMCSRYSSEHGYICHDCYDELTTAIYQMDIKTFMASSTKLPLETPKDDIETFQWG